MGYLSSFRPVTTNLLETSGPYFLSEYSEGCLLWRGLIVSVIVTKWAFSLWMRTLQRDLRRSQKNGNVFPGWNNICPSSQVSNCSVHFGVTIEFPPNAPEKPGCHPQPDYHYLWYPHELFMFNFPLQSPEVNESTLEPSWISFYRSPKKDTIYIYVYMYIFFSHTHTYIYIYNMCVCACVCVSYYTSH